MRTVAFTDFRNDPGLFLTLIMSTNELVQSVMTPSDCEAFKHIRDQSERQKVERAFRLRRMIVGCLANKNCTRVFHLVEMTEKDFYRRFYNLTNDEDVREMIRIVTQALRKHGLEFGMHIAPELKEVYNAYLKKTNDEDAEHLIFRTAEARLTVLCDIMRERAMPPAWTPPSQDFMSFLYSLLKLPQSPKFEQPPLYD